MEDRQHRLWSGVVRACVHGFRALGLDVGQILREAGIPASVLEHPDARVPVADAARLWPAAQAQWGRAGLGLRCGAAVPFGEMGVFDYLIASAPTLGQGLAAAAAASTLLSAGLTRLEFERDVRGHGHLRHVGPFPLQVRDFSAAALTARVRQCGAKPTTVALVGPPLAPPEAYRSVLGVTPHFHVERGAIVLRAEDLDRELPNRGLRGLAPILDREVQRLVNDAGPEDITALVRQTITCALPSGTPALGEVAHRLGMSPRTLQRRLAERGLTLRHLVDETRYELARHHLEARQLRVTEIAFLLGYSEPSAFAHAFRRWSGCSPTAWRRARCREAGLEPGDGHRAPRE